MGLRYWFVRAAMIYGSFRIDVKEDSAQRVQVVKPRNGAE